jgi:hypothetical protein
MGDHNGKFPTGRDSAVVRLRAGRRKRAIATLIGHSWLSLMRTISDLTGSSLSAPSARWNGREETNLQNDFTPLRCDRRQIEPC